MVTYKPKELCCAHLNTGGRSTRNITLLCLQAAWCGLMTWLSAARARVFSIIELSSLYIEGVRVSVPHVKNRCNALCRCRTRVVSPDRGFNEEVARQSPPPCSSSLSRSSTAPVAVSLHQTPFRSLRTTRSSEQRPGRTVVASSAQNKFVRCGGRNCFAHQKRRSMKRRPRRGQRLE